MTNNPDDGRSYLMTVGLIVTVEDSLAFRSAMVSFGAKEGELVMTNQRADLTVASDFISERIRAEGLWDIEGASVKIHSLSGTSYKPTTSQ